ncbi:MULTISPECIES: ABC transporter substrate-binding protein [Bradyrhizobium]|uniref:Iron(III) transport system substrate-binding protein n=2 Tax=Bradyrhizobium TaxID=374 RepID=A0ABY0PEJ4_9BRAD|nr:MULTISPECIES: ABC transporter substrate-binding protein [Bradyrhizobium]SDI18237.1 iron(III) transport system substrate-binding protein [Bradyrhizobium ottawaense]SED76002.1 iron(III) transport system substrate-binding protein [Bradyrhizobium lablabi]SHL71551.1 iron(III) transport system substrate-binding protein [Bradyrhizobium lablabi]
MKSLDRRKFITTTFRALLTSSMPALASVGARNAHAQSADLASLAKEASKAGRVIWYDSSPTEHIAGIIAVFNRAYPDVQVRHVRIDSNAIGARIIQETQANAPTADIGISTSDQVWTLSQQKVLLGVNWGALGVSVSLSPNANSEYLINVAPFHVLLWNKRNVADDKVPNSWEEVLDPKWRGRVGTWVRPAAFVQLAKVWGEEKARDYLVKFTQQKPYLSPATVTMAQQVVAGEYDICIGVYNSAQPAIKAGAPLGLKVLNPTPISTLYSFIPKNSQNPAGGKLLAVWLSSLEGARTYEDATDRGNRLIPGTRTADLLAKRQIADFSPEEVPEVVRLTAEFTEILGRAGAAR